MGFPIHLKNPNYERAKFQFNFCLLISDEDYEKNFIIYELLLKKVAKTLQSLEIDEQYDFIKKKRNFINDFFDNLYKCLIKKEEVISIMIKYTNSDGSDDEDVDDSTQNTFYFFFKFIDFSKGKCEILSYQVPVWIKYIDYNEEIYFENGIREVIEQIDGVTHIKSIASKLEVDINYVIYVVQNLSLAECITMVDIFQVANIYRATINLKSYFNKCLLDEFINFCEINISLFNNNEKHRQIMKIYSNCEDENNYDDLNDSTLNSPPSCSPYTFSF